MIRKSIHKLQTIYNVRFYAGGRCLSSIVHFIIGEIKSIYSVIGHQYVYHWEVFRLCHHVSFENLSSTVPSWLYSEFIV